MFNNLYFTLSETIVQKYTDVVKIIIILIFTKTNLNIFLCNMKHKNIMLQYGCDDRVDNCV